ncbi:unnamed protein product [Mesocestoides corti]|uniref:Uncharacterized protein n=1 Tax=Mesocestoides corti TaxID=53468 RepID=A0A3P6HRQ8_MESCO|nr:unnamed protein product [Mesocestoides corti]
MTALHPRVCEPVCMRFAMLRPDSPAIHLLISHPLVCWVSQWGDLIQTQRLTNETLVRLNYTEKL